MAVGEGLWKTATKLRPFRTDFFDPQTGTAAVHAVVEENSAPVLLAARLRVVNRRITEIETIVVRNRQEGALFEPDALRKRRRPWSSRRWRHSACRATRSPRSRCAIRRASVGSFETSNVPFARNAYRLENGVRMAGPGCTFQPPSCENMRGQRLPTLASIVAHVVAVDEENGTVLLWMDFGPGSLPGPAELRRGRS